MRKSTIIIVALIVISISLFYFKQESNLVNEILEIPIKEQATSTTEIKKEEILIIPVATTTPEIKITEINLDVPFSSQAPFSDWSEPYQNACEETAALMVAKYYQKEALTPTIAKQEILDLVAWENKTFGYYEDTTADETAQILRDYYGFKHVDVLYDPTLDDIKAQVLAGRPVIIPASGQMLGNPNFKRPGPIYHMLVIKGITKTGDFITNDSGTRNGHNYIYKPDILYAAIHDALQGGHSISKLELDSNRKVMIVVYPN
ncbi:MAG TPA: C39 family peptidase [Candidatus Saccharimonadales bacterium]|nr:C39 family peptidase [Candidatus Saccharimonadales bacterium]